MTPIPHSRPWIKSCDRDSVNKTLKSGIIAGGELVQSLNDNLIRFLGTNALGYICNSGTAALVHALKILKIGNNDDVIIPNYVCNNVLAAVFAVGATPILSDVDKYGVIDSDTVKKVITPKTRAIIGVHTYGHPCDILELEKFGVPVIEDACQAFGLKIGHRWAGTLGHMGVLSFHATKCITTGEGGMLIINQNKEAVNFKNLNNSNSLKNPNYLTTMSDLQAALGLSQLERYTEFLERRREIFESYHQEILKLNNARSLYKETPSFLFRFTINTELRFDSIKNEFLKDGIHVRRGVDALLHQQMSYDKRQFTNSLNLYNSVVSLPFYPSLTEKEEKRVIQAIKRVFNGS
tara:strand:- start:4777 stop:5826 length:1050 start_codon:yes stop_codon:yes gene_type:complete